MPSPAFDFYKSFASQAIIFHHVFIQVVVLSTVDCELHRLHWLSNRGVGADTCLCTRDIRSDAIMSCMQLCRCKVWQSSHILPDASHSSCYCAHRFLEPDNQQWLSHLFFVATQLRNPTDKDHSVMYVVGSICQFCQSSHSQRMLSFELLLEHRVCSRVAASQWLSNRGVGT
jgi:hypothetical protein